MSAWPGAKRIFFSIIKIYPIIVWKIMAIQWPFYKKSKAWQLKFLFSARSVLYIDISDKTHNFIIKWISGARVLTSETETFSKSCISWINLNNEDPQILNINQCNINFCLGGDFWRGHGLDFHGIMVDLLFFDLL